MKNITQHIEEIRSRTSDIFVHDLLDIIQAEFVKGEKQIRELEEELKSYREINDENISIVSYKGKST